MKQTLAALIIRLKGTKLIYIIGALVLLIVVGVGGFFIFNTVKKQRSDIQSSLKGGDRIVKVFREVTINGKTVNAELAQTPEERIHGLMGRTVLDEGTGMLFTFGEESSYTFWMKNMKISIDIIWIDAGMAVADTDLNVPPCSDSNCESYTPLKPIKYVLETPSGWVEKNNIKIGDSVVFGNDITEESTPSQNQ